MRSKWLMMGVVLAFGMLWLNAPLEASKSNNSSKVNANKQSLTLGLRTPALSPDGKTLAFGFQGDIWRISMKGGSPVRLTAHPAYDGHPRWSPDGSKILFTSRREGNRDLYTIAAQGGAALRLTFHSADDVGADWSPDGKWIVFTSNRANSRSLFRISSKGGMPVRLVEGYWNWVYGGRVGPKGRKMLFSEGMDGWSFWWRKGYKGPNYTRLHVYDLKSRTNRQLNAGPHNALWPMWAAEGNAYYYMSEQSGLANLWKASLDGKMRKQLTSFTKGPIRWPSINRKGTHIVFERNFRLWSLDLRTSKVKVLPISIKADSPRSQVTWKTSRKVSEFSLSPDGKKIAFISEGEVFVTDANAKTSIRRLTHTPWREQQVIWSKDSLHVLYTSERGKGYILIRRSARRGGKEKILLRTKYMILFPRFSPDGKTLAYLEGKNRWMLLKKGSKKPALLVKAQIAGLLNDAPKWSPDGKWLMYMAYNRARGSLWAKRVGDASAPVRLTRTAAHDSDGAWTPDGKYVLYQSNRHGTDWFHQSGDTNIYVLSLRHRKPTFREDKLDALFKKKSKKSKKVKKRSSSTTKKSKKGDLSKKKRTKAKKKTKTSKKKAKTSKKQTIIDQKDLHLRARRVTRLRGNEGWPIPSPNGKKVVFFSNSMGSYQLYVGSFSKGKLRGARRFAASLRFRGAWSSYGLTWGPKGKFIYLMHRGQIVKVSVPKGRVKRLRIRVQVSIDRQKRYLQMFREVWLTLRDHFYDPAMHGQNWGAIYKRFLPVIAQVKSKEDWRIWMNEMLGTLNASHLGVYNPRGRSKYRTGMLGVNLVPQGRHLWIKKIFSQGPIHRVMRSLKGGQVQLLAIGGVPVHSGMNPYSLLRNKSGKRVSITLNIQTKKKGKKSTWKKSVINIQPISQRTERGLRYRAWVNERKRLVAKWSGGKIGYLHMSNMSRSALYRFIRDYETHIVHKKAAIIDLRFNMGGNVHDTVLRYLSRRRYGAWQIRGMRRWSEPSHALLPKPMVMLINQVTLSDGEMTASGFKALKLGKLVGTATYHWLIFTYQRGLLGGGAFRLPDWGCYSVQGKDLEKTGVTPDITVHNTLADRLKGKDPQLKKAISVLQKQLQK